MQRIQLLGLLFFSSFCGIAQQTPVTENPIAFQYLLKHFGLKGKVKSVTTNGSNNYLMTQELFDQEGRMTTQVNFSGSTTKSNYTYNKPKNLLTVAYQTGNLPVINNLYQYNNNQEVEYSLHKEGDPLRKFEYKGSLLIKDSGANRYSTQKVYYSYYEYNNKGQLIKSKDFNGSDKLSREELFTYEANVVTIKGKAYPSYAGANEMVYEKKKYYDTKGNLIKSTYTQNGKTETTEYKLDTYGNWIWKTGGMTRRIEYYDTPLPTNSVTGKTDAKDQLSLLVDENFDNNNNKWVEWDNEGSSAQLYKGNYRITAKNSNNYATWMFVPKLSDLGEDFTIETKIFLNSTETGNANDSYWLFWGVGNSAKDFYAFGIYPEGKFQYGKTVNSQWDGKAGTISSSAINVGANKANVLRVEKRKDAIFFFINGSEVHKANYEKFNINHTGIGFQVNGKKVADIDYLKIFRGSVPTITVSPEPQESKYQQSLAKANNSKERADAIIDYYLALQSLSYTTEQLEKLLGKKFLQMMDIDFHGFYQVLMSKRIKGDDVKLCMKASEVLTTEQRNAVKLIANYTVEDFQATQNNTAKPSYPAGVPRPGYGWGKTVSSDKIVNSNNGTTNPPTVVAPAKPKDELTILKEGAKYLQGQMVYLSTQKTNYFVPQIINIKSVSDEITLVGIGSKYSYSYSSGRNEFGIRSLTSVSQTIKVRDLLSMIDRVSGAYIVTQIGPCGKCSGQGGSWNNSTRTRSYCNSCNATGCVPTYIWNNGSSRAF